MINTLTTALGYPPNQMVTTNILTNINQKSQTSLLASPDGNIELVLTDSGMLLKNLRTGQTLMAISNENMTFVVNNVVTLHRLVTNEGILGIDLMRLFLYGTDTRISLSGVVDDLSAYTPDDQNYLVTAKAVKGLTGGIPERIEFADNTEDYAGFIANDYDEGQFVVALSGSPYLTIDSGSLIVMDESVTVNGTLSCQALTGPVSGLGTNFNISSPNRIVLTSQLGIEIRPTTVLEVGCTNSTFYSSGMMGISAGTSINMTCPKINMNGTCTAMTLNFTSDTNYSVSEIATSDNGISGDMALATAGYVDSKIAASGGGSGGSATYGTSDNTPSFSATENTHAAGSLVKYQISDELFAQALATGNAIIEVSFDFYMLQLYSHDGTIDPSKIYLQIGNVLISSMPTYNYVALDSVEPLIFRVRYVEKAADWGEAALSFQIYNSSDVTFMADYVQIQDLVVKCYTPTTATVSLTKV